MNHTITCYGHTRLFSISPLNYIADFGALAVGFVPLVDMRAVADNVQFGKAHKLQCRRQSAVGKGGVLVTRAVYCSATPSLAEFFSYFGKLSFYFGKFSFYFVKLSFYS